MRIIEYPIFLACRDHSGDLFWKKIFENLANGEPPKGIYFKMSGNTKDNCLYSTIKKKEFTYSFQNREASTIYQELFQILSQSFGIKTKAEFSSKKEAYDSFRKLHSTQKKENFQEWGKIRKKTLKETLLQDFCINAMKKYLLTNEQMKRLYFFLTIGLVFKMFLPGDIQMMNGEIIKVVGLDFEQVSDCPEKYDFRITRPFIEPSVKKLPGEGIYLFDLWEAHKSI